MADTTASKNQKYFNEQASSYDTKHEKTINQLIAHIQKRKDFIGAQWVVDDSDDEPTTEADGSHKPSVDKDSVRFLDYACGTGLVTRCVGIDISENMVASYNARAENQGLEKEEMYAYQGNLLNKNDPNPASLSDATFFNFDVAAVGLGAHHFEDPDFAVRQITARLRPGGVFFILDFLPHEPFDGHQHKAVHTVTHHGFSEERVRDMFTRAGVGKGFELQDLGSGVVFAGMGKDGSDMKRRPSFNRKNT
ncbi:unnamed protein product [Parascedosporium putredinis]|uniref:Methyltransferase type 11 domain-containing protein n=1 Tax=Parascedosporium putredinis TaxID=1442378 RepID=A0A9P1H9V5_9PEZI|nr:unnamed protein product [Parascedosporium putredinis]CAI8001376.1 unnamed protein product [Parascedosporium putredinis]